MPAGDLVTKAGQVEVGGVLMGTDTDFIIHRPRGGVRGLRGGEMKVPESEYAHADGSFIGETFRAARTITVALLVSGATAAAANANVDVMDGVWNRPTTEDEPLYVWLPGMSGKRYVVGRPIGVVFEEEQQVFASVPALAMFRVTDPTIHT